MRDTVGERRPEAETPLFTGEGAWRSAPLAPSLAYAFRSVPTPAAGALAARLGAFVGPGFLIAVGYIDPGNWATDIAGGSAYGYDLLSIVVVSGLMAMLMQALAARLGVATGRDLAQACRDASPPIVGVALWIAAEIGICACDLAELMGVAIALQLLFHLPLLVGIILGVLDVLLVLGLERTGFRRLEAFVGGLIVLTALAVVAESVLARPDLAALARGLLPSARIVSDPGHVYLAVGIIGATVMPHNLYLHSAIVQTRRYALDQAGRRHAARMAGIDNALALCAATLINAALLVLAAAGFHARGLTGVSDITQAHDMLVPLLGGGAAMVFALGLLCSGQSSSLTATLAGQVVMEGFVRLRLAPWKRRLLTRFAAAVPAVLVVALAGEGSVGRLLILSQVILALQLPLAMIPLIAFVGDRRKMGPLVVGPLTRVAAWATAAAIVGLDAVLVIRGG